MFWEASHLKLTILSVSEITFPSLHSELFSGKIKTVLDGVMTTGISSSVSFEHPTKKHTLYNESKTIINAKLDTASNVNKIMKIILTAL